VWQLGGALKGLMSDFWMLDMPKKGQRLPQKGLTSHLLLILCHLSSSQCKNSVNFVVSLIGCFDDLFCN
jgi:hypothetical protein